MRYSKEFKLQSVKIGNDSISGAAKKRNIPKQTLARWVKIYRRYGAKGLENKKPGAKEKKIDAMTEKKILNLWRKKKRSAYKMLRDLGKKGPHLNENNKKTKPISKREVYKIYKKYNLGYEKNEENNF